MKPVNRFGKPVIKLNNTQISLLLLAAADNAYTNNQRHGQSLFNTLDMMYPEAVAACMIGNEDDPFYSDELIPNFIKSITE